MKKTHTQNFWVGFVEGVPHVGIHEDNYGTTRGSALLFHTKGAARLRYEDVRLCEVQIKEKV